MDMDLGDILLNFDGDSSTPFQNRSFITPEVAAEKEADTSSELSFASHETEVDTSSELRHFPPFATSSFLDIETSLLSCETTDPWRNRSII